MTDQETIDRLVIQLARATGTPESLVRLGAGIPPAAVGVAWDATGRRATGNASRLPGPTTAETPVAAPMDHYAIARLAANAYQENA